WHYWNRLCHADIRTVHLAPGHPAFSPDGTRVALLMRDNSNEMQLAKVWDTTNGKLLPSVPVGKAVPVGKVWYEFRLSAGGKRLATLRLEGADPDTGVLTVWDTATARELLRVKGRFIDKGLAISPDGERVAALVVVEKDIDINHTTLGQLRVWKVATE